MTRKMLWGIVIFGAAAVTLALFFQDTRLPATILWGAGVVIVWGFVFVKALRQWRAYHDRRALGDVRSDGALFIVAAFAGAAISLALLTPELPVDDILRQLARMFSAVALGAFLMAGVVKLTESPPDPPDDVQGHRMYVAGRR